MPAKTRSIPWLSGFASRNSSATNGRNRPKWTSACSTAAGTWGRHERPFSPWLGSCCTSGDFPLHECRSMSASPLPAVNVASQSSAASAAQASSARNNQRGGDAAFDSHLQHAQQQASTSDDNATQAERNGQQQNSNQNGNTPTGNNQGAQTQSATDANAGAAGQGGATDDSSNASGADTLASAVLSLIDKATGDASGAATTVTAAKPASIGSTKPSASTAQQASHALQAVVGVPPLPSPAAIAARGGKGGGDGEATTSQISGVATSGAGSASAQSSLAVQKSSVAGTNDDDGNDAGGSSANAASSADNSASSQNAGDGTQALAGALIAGTHVAADASAPSVAANGPTQGATDLSALRGVFDTSAVVPPSGTNIATGHSLSVNSPVGSSSFAKELGQQVTWLSGQDVKQAQIRLNPQDLGPLDVKVSVEHGRVDVVFMAQHPAAVAAVQQGLGQLNQMLGGQGLSLGHTTVGQHGAQQQSGGQPQQQASGQSADDSDNVGDASVVSKVERVAVGLLDAFA
ncbi:flagellar hook-length control protein FliK [Dyella psychrodurans]|uniref:Flagellar hook-length control protein FliK n=2 Tax=Dyella psychrodurans TaxID=1927960 RepID=A0A370X0Q2_9GAMM|nr:flagellar hook-length control protein FliK [Dyella psychrodurans]